MTCAVGLLALGAMADNACRMTQFQEGGAQCKWLEECLADAQAGEILMKRRMHPDEVVVTNLDDWEMISVLMLIFPLYM